MNKDIAFCLNNGYVDYCYITMLSILDNNKSAGIIRFHLLTDHIDQQNKKKLNELINKYQGSQLAFYYIDKDLFKGFNLNFSVYAWFRVILPDVLPNHIKKVLYLDCDTIVAKDLEELFNYNIADSSIAAVKDKESLFEKNFERLQYPMHKKYICSGVMLMNLQYWRENKISEKITDYGRENQEKCIFPDQDAINYICQDSKIILPLKYGTLNSFHRHDLYDRAELLEALLDPVIIHYAGNAPWKHHNNPHVHRELWWKYFRKSKLGVKIPYNYYSLGIKNNIRRLLKNVLKPSARTSSRDKRFMKKDYLLKKIQDL